MCGHSQLDVKQLCQQLQPPQKVEIIFSMTRPNLRLLRDVLNR